MSVVAAARVTASRSGERKYLISSDGQANYGDGYCSRSSDKLLICGPVDCQFVLGVVGSFRVRDMLEEMKALATFDMATSKDVRRFRSLLSDYLDAEHVKPHVVAEDLSFQLLGVSRAGIFSIYSDMQVLYHDVYCAIGTGAEVSSGVLYVHSKLGLTATSNATVDAVDAACVHRCDCGYPLQTHALVCENKVSRVSPGGIRSAPLSKIS